ncbi:DoxX family protein [Mucilaginibacter sp. 22184]|uniref:DoxX family protein n=1 Tax=Mucilaginibacter sp. 22184 TaxID=3453887 RepID=UPI003F845016
MKTIKIIYWVSTVIVAIMMINSAIMYVTVLQLKETFIHLGFPNYFRIELAVMKLIGSVILLLPVWKNLKEWTYAGFAITFISAFIAHCSVGDPILNRIMPILFLLILAISYIAYHRKLVLNSKK